MGGQLSSTVLPWLQQEAIPEALQSQITTFFEEHEFTPRPNLVKVESDDVDPSRNEALVLSLLPRPLATDVRLLLYSQFLTTSTLLKPMSTMEEFPMFFEKLLAGVHRVAVLPGDGVPTCLPDAVTHGEAEPHTAGLYFVRHGVLLVRDVGRSTKVLPAGSVVELSTLQPVLTTLCIAQHGAPVETREASPVEGQPPAVARLPTVEASMMDSTRLSLRAATSGLLVLGFVEARHVEDCASEHPVVADSLLAQKVQAAALQQERFKVRIVDDATDALFAAVEAGDEAGVDALLEAGDAQPGDTRSGNTLLHAVASSASLPILSKLLATGIDASAANDELDTPLHRAAAAGWADGVAALASVCSLAAINASNTHGNSPAHLVAASGSEDAMRALVAATVARGTSVPLTLLNEEGKTPLMMCGSVAQKRALKPRTDLGKGATIR